MKRFIIVCVIIITLGFCVVFLMNNTGLFLNLNINEPVKTFTTTEGKTILLDSGKGMEPFEIRGVDMGVGIPGHFATDYAIDKETYLRWFKLIQEMGANCVRVYTILADDFYEAVWEYNKDNDNPLYIIHGLWVNDYVLYSHRDAYDSEFLGDMLKDSRTLVDILHGNKKLSLGEGLGSGRYTKDISPWVVGYILGVEWEDTTVAYTNHMQSKKNSYNGKYMYTTDEATPFEAFLAQVGDKIIAYETSRYKTQRLVAFSNWPTTDPFEWSEKVEAYFRKFEKIDVEHIKTTDEFLSGQFATYHIYPYYPDYLGFADVMNEEIKNRKEFTNENGIFNSYRAYLSLVNQHHTIPVVVSEYGVPSSRGRAQTDRNTGRSQGGMSEKQQGEALVQCYNDIMAAGCAGSVMFTWQDEWFKRTWNTMAYTDLTKTPFWSDYQTNEQYFGILSFDPGETQSLCYVDGNTDEWTEHDNIIKSNDIQLDMKYDEKYVYFKIHKDNYDADRDVLYIPIDTTPKTGSKTWKGTNVRFERAADFVIVIDGRYRSKILVQKRYEALRAIYSHRIYAEDAYVNVPEKDTSVFVPINLVLQIPDNPIGEMEKIGYEIAEVFETGKLTYGNGNPKSSDFNSLADFIINGDDIEMRLPWSILNFLNPSEMMIHDDYYEHYGIEGLKINELYAGIGYSNGNQSEIKMGKLTLKGWGRKPKYHERLKQGYYDMKELWSE